MKRTKVYYYQFTAMGMRENGKRMSLRLATSTRERVGRKTDAFLNDGYDTQFASDAKVFYDTEEDNWVMFYGGAHIMIAFSRDLIHWVRDSLPL